MADAINTSETDGGESIPAALAATPASRKPRGKGARPAKIALPVVPAPIEAAAPEPAIEPATPVEAERPVETVADATRPEIAPETPAPVSVPPSEPVAEVPEPAPVPTPPAAVPAEPQKETIMATTIENMTDTTAKAQAFFSDAGERTKGAVAKSTRMFEEATAFGKGNVEALVESSKIAAKGIETMGQDVAEFGRKSFEDATAAFKTLATVKSPTEFMKLQGDFMRQSFDALVAETSRSTETMLKLAGEVAQPISNRMAVAAEKMKPVA